jgi:anti-sigma B factor antagonist
VDLDLDVSERDGVTVIAARGELDLGSSPRLRDLAVKGLMGGNRALVIDLSDVAFIDSTGLGTLVAVLKRARSLGGDVGLVIVLDRVRKLFELTGLTAAFAIHGDLDATVAAVQSHGKP